MIRFLSRCFAAAVMFSLAAVPALAAAAPKEVTVKVGDPAPKLSIDKWVKGEPVKEFEKGKVYVVEFWATWCGPCKVSIPHVTKLQAKFKDKGLVVIGVDIWENDLAKVEPFVTEMGDKMNYTVCTEAPIAGSPSRGRMATDWMTAAGRNGIPCSFIIDKEAKIAWIGHPMQMERPLAKVIDGTFDAKADAELQEKIAGMNKEAMALTGRKEYDEALKLRDEIIKLSPEDAESQQLGKLSILMNKGDAEAANKLAEELLDKADKEKDSLLAARVASMLLNSPAADKADKGLALKAAKQAYDGSDKSLTYQRMLAQAYAANKQFDKAVELQEKVVGQINGPLKVREQKNLDDWKEQAKSGNRTL